MTPLITKNQDLSEVVARLVREAVLAERERCARICEAVQSSHMLTQPMVALGAEECATKILAAAVRAQGSKA